MRGVVGFPLSLIIAPFFPSWSVPVKAEAGSGGFKPKTALFLESLKNSYPLYDNLERPNCKESEITAQDIVQPNATRAYWKALLGLDRKSAQTIDTVSDEYESRVGGIKFFVGLLDNNALHVHLASEFL
ncbi:MAG: hypothetical protein ACP5SH_03005 [Syntrophobacteraceae bacterium]